MGTLAAASRSPKDTTGYSLDGKVLPAPSSKLLRLNGLCPYYTMFPLSFPFRSLARAQHGDWLIDPFCGRGTSNFAARLRGIPSVGIDSNPVAAAIARAKLVDIRPGYIIQTARRILETKQEPSIIPEGDFWDLAYHPETLLDICKLREHLLKKRDIKSEVALRALTLGILHGPMVKGKPTYLSNQMPRTYATKPAAAVRYWRKKRLRPKKIDVLDAISRRAHFSFAELPTATEGEVFSADSRHADLGSRRRFRWVITSPPYYGMRTYVPDQWLRNWFLGGPADVEYSMAKQIPHKSEDEFVAGLAAVWKKMASVCLPGAKMIIRFGALPSSKKEPRDLLSRTLAEAKCGWRTLTLKKAGTAKHGRRQYDQFGPSLSTPIDEIDLYAMLED